MGVTLERRETDWDVLYERKKLFSIKKEKKITNTVTSA